MFAVHVAGSGGIGHSRLVQLSDWLSIVGIMMSTLMSVIAIAVGVHLRKRDSERPSKREERASCGIAELSIDLTRLSIDLASLWGGLWYLNFNW